VASFSDYWENAVLDGTFGDPTTPTITAPTYLALCTTVPTDASTGSTIVEATGATGYARKSIAAADMSAAASGSKTNSNQITFAAITAGSATVIGWALCDASTAGNVLCWGTCTSTVISQTQSPPVVAVGGLVVTLD
jgi:hypothetical protein